MLQELAREFLVEAESILCALQVDGLVLPLELNEPTEMTSGLSPPSSPTVQLVSPSVQPRLLKLVNSPEAALFHMCTVLPASPVTTTPMAKPVLMEVARLIEQHVGATVDGFSWSDKPDLNYYATAVGGNPVHFFRTIVGNFLRRCDNLTVAVCLRQQP